MRAVGKSERGVCTQHVAVWVKQVSLVRVLRSRIHGQLCVFPSDGCFLDGFVQASSFKLQVRGLRHLASHRRLTPR